MDELNEIINSWNLELLQEKKKKKNTARDVISGKKMSFPSTVAWYAFNPEEKDETDEIQDSGGMAVELGDNGFDGSNFDAGYLGTATSGGE